MVELFSFFSKLPFFVHTIFRSNVFIF
jgi:hypothetical protein